MTDDYTITLGTNFDPVNTGNPTMFGAMPFLHPSPDMTISPLWTAQGKPGLLPNPANGLKSIEVLITPSYEDALYELITYRFNRDTGLFEEAMPNAYHSFKGQDTLIIGKVELTLHYIRVPYINQGVLAMHVRPSQARVA